MQTALASDRFAPASQNEAHLDGGTGQQVVNVPVRLLRPPEMAAKSAVQGAFRATRVEVRSRPDGDPAQPTDGNLDVAPDMEENLVNRESGSVRQRPTFHGNPLHRIRSPIRPAARVRIPALVPKHNGQAVGIAESTTNTKPAGAGCRATGSGARRLSPSAAPGRPAPHMARAHRAEYGPVCARAVQLPVGHARARSDRCRKACAPSVVAGNQKRGREAPPCCPRSPPAAVSRRPRPWLNLRAGCRACAGYATATVRRASS